MDANITTTDACGIDKHWTRIILIIRCGVAGSALLSCVLVLILAAYMRCRERYVIHLPTLRLVLYITVSSMIRSVIIVIQIMAVATSNFSNYYYCMVTGYLYRTFSFVAILFTLMASIHTLLATFGKFYKRLELFYVLIPILLPHTFVWVPFTYDKALMEAWCTIKSDNDTCNQKLMGFIYNVDVPRLIIEFVNTVLVIGIIIRIPRQYRKLKKQNEDFKLWLQQVIPILVYSILYLALNWFSLTDHINRKFKLVKAEALKVTHSVTSASHGLTVGIVFTAYLLIIIHMSVSVKYTGVMEPEGEYTYSSSVSELSNSTKSENSQLLAKGGEINNNDEIN